MSLRKFEILEMIAKGGMAEVYRAKTVGLEGFAKELCVKKILPHLTEDTNFVTMFINEAKLAASLNYANIVSVHDLCVSADREYFIVMEYVHGKDLSDIIRAAQLAGQEIPPDIAVFIGREIAKGLHYAHTKCDPDGAPLNIIHRDISPQNVLCSFMGEVKITDFGIAKASSIVSKTAVGILKGKYGYMSPEQARGQRLSRRSDVFNLGIVLYEMLVGERCFAGASDYSTLNLMREAVVTPPTKINKSVPAALEAIVLKALSRKPEDRHQTALEIEGALADYARSEGAEMGATDLSRFLQDLFAGSDEEPIDRSTGVLDLSSVVGPPPDKEPEPAKASKPSKPAAAKASDAPADEADRDEAPAKPAEVAKKSPAAAKSAPKPSSAPEPKDSEPKASESKKASPKKPARIKPKPSDKAAEKKRKKAEAIANRKPVGRKNLKPGLTDLAALEKTGRWALVARVAGVLLVATVFGAAVGWYQSRGHALQALFRASELTDRAFAGSTTDTVAVVIESEPPGARVWIDGIRLADRTPLSVRRERDGKPHKLELALASHQRARRDLTFEDGAVTIVREKLIATQGSVRVRSTPSGIPVRIDGEDEGSTPVTVDVPWGRRKIELGAADTEQIVTYVQVKPGKRTTLHRNVLKKGEGSTLAIRSTPAARIIVNGQPTDATTNGDPLELDPGVTHRVELIAESENLSKTLKIQLRPGERRRMYVDLDDAS